MIRVTLETAMLNARNHTSLLYKCVCLREYWSIVDQEDIALSGVTLNFVDFASVFVLSVKNLRNGQFMIQGHFEIYFHPPAGQEI